MVIQGIIAGTISAHAWNADQSMLAMCPGTNEVWIYTGCHDPKPENWKKTYVLDQVCKSICWDNGM